jgi:hypothetical protein
MTEELVRIGSYSTLYEANLVKSELEAFGIQGQLRDAAAIGANWLWSNALGGVKVQVPESQADEARLILEAEPECEIDAPAAAVCPGCGGGHTRYYLDKRGSFLTWLILGVPVIPAFSRMVCADCGWKWRSRGQ